MSSPANALLVADIITNILYGIYLHIAFRCVVVFWQKHKTQSVHNFQFICFLILTLLCTLKIILDNFLIVRAFTNIPPDGIVHYVDFNELASLFLTGLWVVETTVADAVITYRVWIVWGKRWMFIVIPTLLLIAGISMCFHTVGVYTMVVMASVSGDNINDFVVVARISNIWMGLTLALNLLCTSLVAYRIWTVRREVSAVTLRKSNDPLKRVFNVIIESAAIYTVLMLVIIVLSVTGSVVVYIFVPQVPPVISIVFATIILRCGKVEDDSLELSGDTGGTSAIQRNVYELHSRSGDYDTSTHGAIQVKLDRVTTRKIDGESGVHYVGSTTDDTCHP